MKKTLTFNEAVTRLTLLYMGILAVVCVVFSGAIYQFASNEIDDGLRRQVVGFRGMFGRVMVDDQATEQLRLEQATIAHANLRTKLFLTNMAVIGVGSGLCYWFAKKTLEPLEENVKNQERFTADASHELRTPLAVMRSEIEVSLRDKNLTIDEARSILESNLEEIGNLNDMVNQLLHLARSGELGEKTVIIPRELARQVVQSFAPKVGDRKLTVTKSASTQKIEVHDSVVEHVLRILIDNAIKYAGDTAQIVVDARLDRRQLVVQVSDNGPGVAPDAKEKIFERFYRADSSRTKQGIATGHGLGLSIARQLVAKAGGTLNVDSTEGKGATFTLKVPCVTIDA